MQISIYTFTHRCQIPKFQFATHRPRLSASRFSLSSRRRTSAQPLSVSSSWASLPRVSLALSSSRAQRPAQPLPSSTVTPSLAPHTRSSLVLQPTGVFFFFYIIYAIARVFVQSLYSLVSVSLTVLVIDFMDCWCI